MSGVSQPGLRVIVLLIAVSVPLFLVLETLLRIYVFGPIYGPLIADLSALYWPEFSFVELAAHATVLAWALIGLTCIAGAIGVGLLRRTVARALAQGDEKPAEAKIRDRLLLLTSIPQVPGLLSTLCFAAGAALRPVLVGVGVSTAFVVIMGFIGESLLEQAQLTSGQGLR